MCVRGTFFFAKEYFHNAKDFDNQEQGKKKEAKKKLKDSEEGRNKNSINRKTDYRIVRRIHFLLEPPRLYNLYIYIYMYVYI